MDINSLIRSMKNRQIECTYFETKENMLEHLKTMIPENASVAWGGSMSLYEAGVIDMIRNGRYNIIDRDRSQSPAEAHELMHKAFFADYYLMSSNAITADGKLVNIDGNGNRVASLIYGPANVIIVAGINKLVKDEAEAMDRIKNMAAPMNATRLKTGSPCIQTGRCMHCTEKGTICCHTVVTRYSRMPGRIKVLLVGEKLGF